MVKYWFHFRKIKNKIRAKKKFRVSPAAGVRRNLCHIYSLSHNSKRAEILYEIAVWANLMFALFGILKF
jgi:hypothetical protein